MHYNFAPRFTHYFSLPSRLCRKAFPLRGRCHEVTDEVENLTLRYCAWVYALLIFPFALMPRGQLLSCVTKVTKGTPKGSPLGNPQRLMQRHQICSESTRVRYCSHIMLAMSFSCVPYGKKMTLGFVLPLRFLTLAINASAFLRLPKKRRRRFLA